MELWSVEGVDGDRKFGKSGALGSSLVKAVFWALLRSKRHGWNKKDDLKEPFGNVDG
jgi:hypothetical protein